MWRKGSPRAWWAGMQAGAATLQDRIEVPQSVKKRATLRPRDSSSGYLPEEKTIAVRKGSVLPDVHGSTVQQGPVVQQGCVPGVLLSCNRPGQTWRSVCK